MKSLNSSVIAMKRAAYMTGAGILMVFLLLSPVFAAAASYQVTVTTDKSIYNPGQTMTVSGTVTSTGTLPSGTAVSLKITSPVGTLLDFGQASVGASGTYSTTFVVGNWSAGSYTVTATWAPNVTATALQATALFQVNGTTTTSCACGTTTIVEQTTTTVVQQTTVTQQITTTVVNNVQTTTTVNAQTTTTVVSAASDTGLYVGIVGVVIAIIAGALSVMALRRK
ncbi:MAG TPA: MG2 domain-containing protein [Nitrososphaerales archaeon]|nr:MG2 domain-containing protein [Nitrososphaerales archaeon]